MLTLLHRLDRLEGARGRRPGQRQVLLAAVGRGCRAADVAGAAVRLLAHEADQAALLWPALANRNSGVD